VTKSWAFPSPCDGRAFSLAGERLSALLFEGRKTGKT